MQLEILETCGLGMTEGAGEQDLHRENHHHQNLDFGITMSKSVFEKNQCAQWALDMSQNQEPGWWRPVWEAGRLDPSHAQQRDKFAGRDSAPDIGCTCTHSKS